MASDKKPSMYSNRGKIGSAEELETYGVWVKSEPQDFTASLAEAAANFNADALPYEADFDTGFDDMGMGSAGFGLLGPELDIPEISMDDDTVGFDDGLRGNEETSSQFLMKIAGELSSIRSELNVLKKEFAELRGEDVDETADAASAGAEDGAPSDDSMETFFNAADFPSEEEMGFDDSQRDADEAALKELDTQSEEEEIPIDFDNLDGDAVAEAEQDELPPLEGSDDDDFEMPSFDTLSFEETPSSELGEQEDGEQAFDEELAPLEEDEELRELRLEGAEPLASPPENADYLEEDPFALNNADLESSDLAVEDAEPVASPEEVISSEELVSNEEASSSEEGADLAFEDLSFDETGFDLGLDDFSTEQAADDAEPAPAVAEATEEEAPVFETDSLELPEVEEETEVEIETESDEPATDMESLDLSDAVIDEPNLSEEIVEPPLEEPVLGDISFEDEISLDMGGFDTELEVKDDSAAELDVESADFQSDDLPSDLDLEIAAKTDDLELDQADDFAADDLAADIEAPIPEIPDTDKVAAPLNGIISDLDDSVIPEGLEVNAKEADPSLDDDLESFTDGDIAGDDSPADSADKLADDSGEFAAIPPALKTELKNVLSYMDHLLESLPEDKIEEFAQSEYFDKYKKIFKELGLV